MVNLLRDGPESDRSPCKSFKYMRTPNSHLESFDEILIAGSDDTDQYKVQHLDQRGIDFEHASNCLSLTH